MHCKEERAMKHEHRNRCRSDGRCDADSVDRQHMDEEEARWGRKQALACRRYALKRNAG